MIDPALTTTNSRFRSHARNDGIISSSALRVCSYRIFASQHGLLRLSLS